MKLAAVAGPLGALKDARIQAAGSPKPDRDSEKARPVVNPEKPHRKCLAAPMGLFYVRVRRRVHFKL
jgi:hypothetical protein